MDIERESKPNDPAEDSRGIRQFAEPLSLPERILARCSRCFVSQLYLGMISRTLHIGQVMDEVDALEGGRKTQTKPAEQFKRAPLRGLWHKHYMQADFIRNNIALRWGVRGRAVGREFDALVENVMRRFPDPEMRQKALDHIEFETIVGGHEQRASANRLTGEWIVYQTCGGMNYYLALADHCEGADADARDRELADAIRAVCQYDFPFLVSSFGGEGA